MRSQFKTYDNSTDAGKVNGACLFLKRLEQKYLRTYAHIPTPTNDNKSRAMNKATRCSDKLVVTLKERLMGYPAHFHPTMGLCVCRVYLSPTLKTTIRYKHGAMKNKKNAIAPVIPDRHLQRAILIRRTCAKHALVYIAATSRAPRTPQIKRARMRPRFCGRVQHFSEGGGDANCSCKLRQLFLQ